MTSRALVATPRLVVVDNGELRSCQGVPRGVTVAQLFAVVVLWNADEQGAWVGWLTTTDHRSLCFSVADLEDVTFQRWLCDLPGWEAGRLSAALARSGLHLVWRLGR